MPQVKIGQPTLLAAALSSILISGAVGMTISGKAPSTATVGSRYFWRPTVTGANKATLEFAYVNRPRWSAIYRSSGAIIGVPTEPGLYTDIRIMAGDGVHFVETPPFTISVSAPPLSPQIAISGTPGTRATVGDFYSFTPTTVAAAAPLRYSITSKPSWAQFSPTSGTLSGTPGAGSVGNDQNIVVSVRSGTQGASLPAFDILVASRPEAKTGTANLTWAAPTLNTNGSALTDLSGYILRYGENTASLSSQIAFPASVTDAEVVNLSAGTWYFELAAFNAENGVSQFSQALSKSVP